MVMRIVAPGNVDAEVVFLTQNLWVWVLLSLDIMLTHASYSVTAPSSSVRVYAVFALPKMSVWSLARVAFPVHPVTAFPHSWLSVQELVKAGCVTTAGLSEGPVP